MISVVFRPWRTSWSFAARLYQWPVDAAPARHQRVLVERVDDHGEQRQPEEREHEEREQRAHRMAADAHAASPERLPATQHEEQDHQDAHQRDGERRAERVVAGVLELVREDVAHHQGLAAAEDLGDHVLAEGRDADDDRAGDHAGHRERQDDPPELPPGRGAEVGGRVVDRRVDALERDVDRQDHQRQVGVDDPDRDRRRRVEDADVAVGEAGASRRAGRSGRGSGAGRPTSRCAR